MLAAIILISKAYGPLSGALSSIIFVLSMYKCREGFNMGPSYSEIAGVSSGGYELEALHPGLSTNSLVNITINSNGGVEGTEIETTNGVEGSELEEEQPAEDATNEAEKAIEDAKKENEDVKTSGADQLSAEEALKSKESNTEGVSPDASKAQNDITGCSLNYNNTLNLVRSYNINSRFIDTELGKYNFNEGNVDPNAVLGLRSQLSSSAMVESRINSCQEHLKRLQQEQDTVYNKFESNRFLLSRAKDKLDSYGSGY
jgi:hypothetical protein